MLAKDPGCYLGRLVLLQHKLGMSCLSNDCNCSAHLSALIPADIPWVSGLFLSMKHKLSGTTWLSALPQEAFSMPHRH